MAVDVGADILGHLALQQVRDPHRELDHLQAAGHLAEGVVVGLAVLGRDHLGELVSALQRMDLNRSRMRARRSDGVFAQAGQAAAAEATGPIDLGGRGERHGLFGLARGGIVDWL